GWIRSVTTIEDVRPAGNFAKPLMELASERNWTRIVLCCLDQIPFDIYKSLGGGPVDLIDVDAASVFSPASDDTELQLRRKTAALAIAILEEEVGNGVGPIDHRFVGNLERRLRRAGMEDVIILVTNGRTVPASPVGAIL